MPSPPTNSPTIPPYRLAGLDHLRALAIILVFLYHYRLFGHPKWIDTLGEYGWTGVDLFFVLSGYLIGGQLLGALANGKPLSYKTFYYKRALRILPAYLVILILYFTIPAFIERSSLPPCWKFLTFTQNFGLDLRAQGAFSHAWSLCIEEQFYLVLPLFITFLAIIPVSRNTSPISPAQQASTLHRNLPRRLGISLGFLFLAGFVIRWTCWTTFVSPAPESRQYLEFYKWIYYPTFGRLDGLLAGLGLACLFHFRQKTWQKMTRHGNAVLICALLLIIAACYYCGLGLFENAVAGFAAVAVAYGVLVLAALSPGSLLFRYQSRLTSFLATISYSLYLVHKQMIHLTHKWFSPDESATDSYRLFGISILLSLAAALMLHYGIERPFLRLRDRILLPKTMNKALT